MIIVGFARLHPRASIRARVRLAYGVCEARISGIWEDWSDILRADRLHGRVTEVMEVWRYISPVPRHVEKSTEVA